MDANFLFGISLTASFLAGVLALFAPCCITFLFPTYLGTIFKSSSAKASDGQGKVMFYTLIFALGLSFILIPVALGFRFLIYFLDAYHTEVYYLGAIVLIVMGVSTIKPLFHIPQYFNVNSKVDKKVTAGSVFGLGIMSGLTSSCCAPVLFAAITLTSLSPSLFQAVVVSGAYVLGIVFPLFLLSLGYKKSTSLLPAEKRKKLYTVFQYLGAAIFIVSGITIAVMNYLGKIQMESMEGYGKELRIVVFNISKNFQNPFLDITLFLIIVFIFYKLLKKTYDK